MRAVLQGTLDSATCSPVSLILLWQSGGVGATLGRVQEGIRSEKIDNYWTWFHSVVVNTSALHI